MRACLLLLVLQGGTLCEGRMAAQSRASPAPPWPLAAAAVLLGLLAAADAQRARMCSVCTDRTFTSGRSFTRLLSACVPMPAASSILLICLSARGASMASDVSQSRVPARSGAPTGSGRARGGMPSAAPATFPAVSAIASARPSHRDEA